MSIREAMGKDVMKDLAMLDSHLEASNKPSALISMKLESLRKGFNVGHCIYSREAPLPGNQAPGVDGVFDKRSKRSLGFSDADLERRFSDGGGNGGGKLMSEAEARRLIQAERKQHEEKQTGSGRSERPAKKKRKKSRSSSSSRSRSR